MPFVDNDGTKIHYEVDGTGPPLVLQHGTTSSWEAWAEFGYAQPLAERYQLILIDARGHGASDKPHDPAAYDLRLRAADVVAVLDDLGISTANYFGYSLGGWIGFGMAKYAPERLISLTLGGAHPYEEDMQPFRDVMPSDVNAFMAAMEQVYGASLTPALRARLEKSDLEALRMMTQDRPSLADILPTMDMPCLLYVGGGRSAFRERAEVRGEPERCDIFFPARMWSCGRVHGSRSRVATRTGIFGGCKREMSERIRPHRAHARRVEKGRTSRLRSGQVALAAELPGSLRPDITTTERRAYLAS